MTEWIRDRALLLGMAVVVASCLALVSYVSYDLGFDGVGVIVFMESVLVFGAALSYCGTSWPKWYKRREVRGRILASLLVLFVAHGAVIALAIRRLRAEWGGPVWMGIGLGELIFITVILEIAVRMSNPRSPDSTDRSL